ncbi:MAG: hypothetical protein AB1705_04175 [Verrucomicrobiota bacterium]
MTRTRKKEVHRIEVNLRDLSQLFNSMDPSPFNEKDLDHDAEEFITSWAMEYPRRDPIALRIHLQQEPEGIDAREVAEQAIHHYFDYRARLNWLEFKRLMKTGRTSLVIGLLFLFSCLFAVEMVGPAEPGTGLALLRESLTIGGWVAMWRPLEIYLYEWWPLRRRGQIFEKMSRMPIEVKVKHAAVRQGSSAAAPPFDSHEAAVEI